MSGVRAFYFFGRTSRSIFADRVPPGTAHGFGNAGSAPATLLLIISPAGVHEEYFRELAAILARPGAPDTAAIADLRQRDDTVQVSALTAP